MSKHKPCVAVVGAGIAGLTASILLQQAGYECTIYEQAPQFRRLGAGINLAPNSIRIFRSIGIEQKLRRVGILPRHKFNREWDTGRMIFSVPVPQLNEMYGAPFMAFHRGDLHDVLASAVTPESFRLGKRFKSLELHESTVHLEFDDGSTAVADAVIGADGVHSRVRDAIRGPEPPDYYGHVAYRSIFPRALLGDLELADNARWWGPDRYLLTYFMSEARDQVYVVTGGPEEWGGSDLAPMQVEPRRLHAAFAGFHPSVQRVLEQCSEVSRWPMLVRPPGLPWGHGPVTLLGDACHPMTPHLGQGGGMAVEDAAILVRCLESVHGQDPALAFRLYETNRFERTAKAQRKSQEDEWGRGKMDHEWLYGYDALTVPIAPLPERVREDAAPTQKLLGPAH
ncbi:MAG: FAD-dependent monooxygenase [Acetobacteraceae bacterium]